MRRIDDLGNGYRLIQNPDGFCYGTDAVCLARFAAAKPGERLMDLCTGTGVIPLLLAGATRCTDMTGLELQQQSAELAEESVKLNNLTDRIAIVQGDVREAHKRFGCGGFDVVTCNPPYMVPGTGKQNEVEQKLIARHEVACTLTDVAFAASRLLRSGGRFYMVHRPERLTDVLCELRAHRLEPKRLQFVCHRAGDAPCLFLIEGQLGRKPGLTILPPMLVTAQSQQEQ